MKRFIDKNGEVFLMINESTFDQCVYKTLRYFERVDSADVGDCMRELCGYIFARYPNQRPEIVKKKIEKSIKKMDEKSSWEVMKHETIQKSSTDGRDGAGDRS